MIRRLRILTFYGMIGLGLLAFAWGAAAEGDSMVKTDADVAAELKLLLGDGNGVTEAYLAKDSTRLQAAIISLRLQGKLEEAMAYQNTSNNFADAGLVNASNQAMLAFLKNNPAYGWLGTGDNLFDPLSSISSQQLYKVLLEVMGYLQGTDFEYMDTEMFAASKGLVQIMGTATLTNAHIATALVEALSTTTASEVSLFSALQSRNVIAANTSAPMGERISMKHHVELGPYLADHKGNTLYFFTKDAEDLDACKGNCLVNWPIFYAASLQIPPSLDAADFAVRMRADGEMQTTYKGWPLYYFNKDAVAGDVNGEKVGGVWFVAKADYKIMIGTSSELGNYLTDDYGRALYYFDKDPAGKSVCENNCLVNWPAYGNMEDSVPSTLQAADFGMITRSNGSMQASFKDFPLYYFNKDIEHGDVLGQGVGNVWYVLNPATFDGTAESKVKTYNVDMKELSFGATLTVEVGSRIVFTNYDDMLHNAVAVNGSFETPLLKTGESHTITLTEAGNYDYYCEPHKSFMIGQIIVK